jgi:hypothetical protein
LDIGSGAGHWIDFYRAVFNARSVTGVEISGPCAAKLKEKYADAPDVSVESADISDPAFQLGRRFSVINAIGVIFHIVDDSRWKTALRNIRAHLEPDGVVAVGGHFGWVTENVQFGGKPGQHNVNKRIRSLRYWRSAARDAGLEVSRRIRTPQYPGLPAPHNNVLFLRPAKSQISRGGSL